MRREHKLPNTELVVPIAHKVSELLNEQNIEVNMLYRPKEEVILVKEICHLQNRGLKIEFMTDHAWVAGNTWYYRDPSFFAGIVQDAKTQYDSLIACWTSHKWIAPSISNEIGK